MHRDDRQEPQGRVILLEARRQALHRAGRRWQVRLDILAPGAIGLPSQGHYVSAMHGVVGLTKTLTLELAEYDINLFEEIGGLGSPMNVMEPGETIEPDDISELYMWPSSTPARYVTDIPLTVDAGMTAN